jgi:hypothetical protein
MTMCKNKFTKYNFKKMVERPIWRSSHGMTLIGFTRHFNAQLMTTLYK